MGNRLAEQRPTGTTPYSYDARDRLLTAGSTTFTYNQNGHQLSAGSSTFTYDLANRLKTTTQGNTTTTYTYDGEGVRLQASTGSAANKKTNFLWDVNGAVPQVALERDGNNTPLRTYLYGVRRLAMTVGANTFPYNVDGLGSVSQLTNTDGTVPRWTYSFDPFGMTKTQTKNVGNAPDNFMKFTGEYLDPTGLYHLRARQYDPAIGRFTTPDPLASSLARQGNANALSAYAYVDGKPTTFVDPSGEILMPTLAGKLAPRFATDLVGGLSTVPAMSRHREASGCARSVRGSSGYRRYSVAFPTARGLPFPFHAGLSIRATPTTCRGDRWTINTFTRVDTPALVGPFGEFRLITVSGVKGSKGSWRALSSVSFEGGLWPENDYWATVAERYHFVRLDPARQLDSGRLVLAVRLDEQQGYFAGLPGGLQKTLEFPLR